MQHDEEIKVFKSPLIPILKFISTIVMIITVSCAYIVGEKMFIDLGESLDFYKYIHPIIFVFIGVLIGMGITIVLSLDKHIRTKIWLSIFSIIILILFIMPLITAPIGTEYYWYYVQRNFEVTFISLGIFGINFASFIPSMIGFVGIWRGKDWPIAVSIIFMTIPPIYSSFTEGLSNGAIILSFLIVYYIIIAGILADIRFMIYPEEDIDRDAHRRITIILMRFLGFLPFFTAVFIIISLISSISSDIITALSPEMIANSIEMKYSAYIIGGALFNTLVALWVAGIIIKKGPAKLKEWMIMKGRNILHGTEER